MSGSYIEGLLLIVEWHSANFVRHLIQLWNFHSSWAIVGNDFFDVEAILVLPMSRVPDLKSAEYLHFLEHAPNVFRRLLLLSCERPNIFRCWLLCTINGLTSSQKGVSWCAAVPLARLIWMWHFHFFGEMTLRRFSWYGTSSIEWAPLWYVERPPILLPCAKSSFQSARSFWHQGGYSARAPKTENTIFVVMCMHLEALTKSETISMVSVACQ